MKSLISITSLFIFTAVTTASAQTTVKSGAVSSSFSQQLAMTAMKTWPDSFALEGDKVAKWRYDQGVILKGIEGIWNATGDAKWFNYIQKSMDFYVREDGSIKGYKSEEYTLDNINNGKLLLLLYRVTGKEKYLKSVQQLREQLKNHPRTSDGGFWHKKIYPYQMWLDGLYMSAPFYAEYAMLFHEDTAFNDVARQFMLMEKHSRDDKTGLLYHGWDESKQQKWADPVTGRSANFWGRALGWYGMALVDALDYFPENHPGKDSIIAILIRYAKAVVKFQDGSTGLWYDVVDKKTESKNYVEASASSMLVYTLAKGVRKGYLSPAYLINAKKGYEGVIKKFIKQENGQTNLHGTVAVSGLGGNPYRDGSFQYYMSERVVVNDPKGMGAFINAAVEMEMLPTISIGKGKTALLDNYFNNEWKKDATGQLVRWHYTWDDKSNSGFSLLGDVFNRYGAKTTSLTTAPTKADLKKASVYIIVDPDTEKETEKPNYVQQKDIDVIVDWVKKGGVLLLMANDSGNCEFDHLNQLAGKFGYQFKGNSKNRVQGNNFEQGIVTAGPSFPLFQKEKLYIKEYSSISYNLHRSGPLAWIGDVMSFTRWGKGRVFVIGDPWLYNEYTDGRKLPADFENYKAAEELVKWLLTQSKK